MDFTPAIPQAGSVALTDRQEGPRTVELARARGSLDSASLAPWYEP